MHSFDAQGARALLKDGRIAEAVDLINSFLLLRDTTVTEQSEALLFRGEAYRLLGPAWTFDAIDTLREALERVENSSLVLRARILIRLMALYTQVPDTVSYGELLDEYLSICRRCSEAQAWLWHAYYNCGVNAIYAREYVLAATALEMALQFASTPLEVGQVKHNLAYTCIRSKRLDQVPELLAASAADLPDEIYGAKILSNKAHFQLAMGDLQPARKTVAQGFAHPSCDQQTRADLLLVQGMIDLVDGDAEAARRQAIMSMDLSFACGYRPGSNAAAKFLEEVAKC